MLGPFSTQNGAKVIPKVLQVSPQGHLIVKSLVAQVVRPLRSVGFVSSRRLRPPGGRGPIVAGGYGLPAAS